MVWILGRTTGADPETVLDARSHIFDNDSKSVQEDTDNTTPPIDYEPVTSGPDDEEIASIIFDEEDTTESPEESPSSQSPQYDPPSDIEEPGLLSQTPLDVADNTSLFVSDAQDVVPVENVQEIADLPADTPLAVLVGDVPEISTPNNAPSPLVTPQDLAVPAPASLPTVAEPIMSSGINPTHVSAPPVVAAPVVSQLRPAPIVATPENVPIVAIAPQVVPTTPTVSDVPFVVPPVAEPHVTAPEVLILPNVVPMNTSRPVSDVYPIGVPPGAPRYAVPPSRDPSMHVPITHVPGHAPVAFHPVTGQPLYAYPPGMYAANALPVVTQPLVPKPIEPRPLVARPVITPAVISQPIVSQPVLSQPVLSQPVLSQPVVSQPVVSQQVVPQQVVPQQVVPQQVATQPVVTPPLAIATHQQVPPVSDHPDEPLARDVPIVQIAPSVPPHDPHPEHPADAPRKLQTKGKGFSAFFFRNKSKTPEEDPPELADSGVPPEVELAVPPPRQLPGTAGDPKTLVYDPKSSVRRPSPAVSDPPSGGCHFHYPPPGKPARRDPSPPVVATSLPPDGAKKKPAATSILRQKHHSKGAPHLPRNNLPRKTRDGATTPVSMTSDTSQVSVVEPVGFGVGYLDIVPGPEDNFEQLIANANEWLQSCQTFKAISFETLRVPCDKDGHVDLENPLSEINGERQVSCVLRMWVVPKSTEDDPNPQHVSYCCLLPRWRTGVSRSGRPVMPTPETLDDTLTRYNADFAGAHPLKGKIINMETLYNLPAFHSRGTPIHMDPDATSCIDNRLRDVNMLSIIRVYYNEGPPAREIVGVQDFVPECTSGKDLTTLEPMSLLVEEAGRWAKTYPDLRITNLQTIHKTAANADDHLNTRHSIHRRRAQFPVGYSRFLRVYYTQLVNNSPEGAQVEAPEALSYKDFVPTAEVSSRGIKKNKLKVKKVEKTGQVMQKLVAWHCLSGQKVVCVETVPLLSKGKMNFDPEDNFGLETGKQGIDYQLLCFRLYGTSAPTGDDKNESDESVQGSIQGSVRGSVRGSVCGDNPNGSVRSHDFAAWPYDYAPTTNTSTKRT